MFYEMEPDIFGVYGITGEPEVPGLAAAFLSGRRIREPVPTPLVFRSNFPSDEPPKAMAGLSIPVWSGDFVKLMRGLGIDNFDAYEAKILGRDPGMEWDGYFAVNVIGVMAVADMNKSRYVPILESPGGGAPFVGFTELHIDESKARGHHMFRLAENNGTLLVSQRVVDALKSNPRPGGWGITALEVGEQN